MSCFFHYGSNLPAHIYNLNCNYCDLATTNNASKNSIMLISYACYNGKSSSGVSTSTLAGVAVARHCTTSMSLLALARLRAVAPSWREREDRVRKKGKGKREGKRIHKNREERVEK